MRRVRRRSDKSTQEQQRKTKVVLISDIHIVVVDNHHCARNPSPWEPVIVPSQKYPKWTIGAYGNR